MSKECLDHVIAGVLFDFTNFLTSREKVIKLGYSEDISPVVEVLTEFMEKRGLNLDCEPMIIDWPSRCANGKIRHDARVLDGLLNFRTPTEQ